MLVNSSDVCVLFHVCTVQCCLEAATSHSLRPYKDAMIGACIYARDCIIEHERAQVTPYILVLQYNCTIARMY